MALNLITEFGPVRSGELLVLTQPLSHGAGYWVVPWLISGAGLYVMKSFDPEETAAISQRPNVFTLKCVPAMLPPLIELDGGAVYESIVYGAAPIPQPVLAAALEKFGPVLAQVYGQSEAPVTLTVLRKEDHLGDGDRRFSAGRAFRSVGVEVWDDEGLPVGPGVAGEVVATGSHLMTGYLGMEDETAAVMCDGWIRTRDWGMMDEDGFLRLLGRTRRDDQLGWLQHLPARGRERPL